MSELPFAPSAERNRAPILEVLRGVLVDGDTVLEIGSGTGQHVVHFAAALPRVRWLPSDRATGAGEPGDGLVERLARADLANVAAPIVLDVTAGAWPATRIDVCYTANTLHIMPWRAVVALFERLPTLAPVDDFRFCAYGPLMIDGAFTSDGNRRFDAMLRAEDPARGLRDLAALDALASAAGMTRARLVEMPSNNHLAVWARSAQPKRRSTSRTEAT